MENVRCYLWKGVHATWPKNWGVYKNFNVNSMRSYKMLMHKCVGWSWWHKTWWKFEWSNFGTGSWTRSLAIGCGMWCYFSSHNSLWQVCFSYQNVSRSKHGGKTSGYIWFNKENLKNVHPHHQVNNLVANPIRPPHKNHQGAKLEFNVVPHHI
jgi:hypothetical protein